MDALVKRSYDRPITDTQLERFLDDAYALFSSKKDVKKILIIPPDFTRYYSMSGKITSMLYEKLKDECIIDILPALESSRGQRRTGKKKKFSFYSGAVIDNL